jgi:hypothetical protein
MNDERLWAICSDIVSCQDFVHYLFVAQVGLICSSNSNHIEPEIIYF